jgi:hypothetical protein
MNLSGKVIALVLVASLLLTGCSATKSFVDPTFPKLSYGDLTKRSEPLRLKLAVEFQRNGQPLPRADAMLRDNAERVLGDSGLIAPLDDGGDGEIKIVMNNIADMSDAASKGLGTDLTFGLAGSTVTDAYEMSVSITAHGKTIGRAAFKHALHTAIGHVSMPPGSEAVSPSVAFGRVTEQLLLRVLRDMQKSGELVLHFAPEAQPAQPSRYAASR